MRVYQIAEYRRRLALFRCPRHQESIVYDRVLPSGCLELLGDLCCELPAAEIDDAFRTAIRT